MLPQLVMPAKPGLLVPCRVSKVTGDSAAQKKSNFALLMDTRIRRSGS